MPRTVASRRRHDGARSTGWAGGSRQALEQVPEQQELGYGEGLAAFTRGVFAEGVRQGGVVIEGQLLPYRLLHDPAGLAGRLAVHVQRLRGAAAAVAAQLLLHS